MFNLSKFITELSLGLWIADRLARKPVVKFGGQYNVMAHDPISCPVVTTCNISWSANVSRVDTDSAWEGVFQPFSPFAFFARHLAMFSAALWLSLLQVADKRCNMSLKLGEFPTGFQSLHMTDIPAAKAILQWNNGVCTDNGNFVSWHLLPHHIYYLHWVYIV